MMGRNGDLGVVPEGGANLVGIGEREVVGRKSGSGCE